jgi:glutamyl-tRNA synthetase
MIENKNQIIKTRFAPSPTGFLHIGSARTALFNHLFSQQNGGEMVLRIEDTDKDRSKKEFEDNILEGLEWLGIKHNEFYRQSEREEVYKKYLQQMIDNGTAYISQEEVKKEGDRSEVIRFKNPNKEIIFTDLIRGEIKFDTTELGDFVIAKSLEEPLYHLAVVVDDWEMKITHIIRGEEGISNTPRQILIQKSIGASQPQYAHIPLILGTDRSKLSKRHGAVSINEFRDQGYLSEALINYLAFLGWNPGTDEEIFSLEELIDKFDLSKVQKGGAIFNEEKLNWINREYIKKMSDEDFRSKVLEFLPESIKNLKGYSEERLKKVSIVLRERIDKFGDIKVMTEKGELTYFFEQPEYEKENLLWKKDKDLSVVNKHLDYLAKELSLLNDFTAEKVKETIWDYVEKEGRGSVLWPMRFALSGRDKSPDPFALAEILGKEEVISRLTYART